MSIKLDNTFSTSYYPTQTKRKFMKCNECHQTRKCDEIHQLCGKCYKAKTVFISSGNKVIDDFIMHTLTNRNSKSMKMQFIPYDRFKDVKFIAEGGFSKIYKATWIDGPIFSGNVDKHKYKNMVVALK